VLEFSLKIAGTSLALKPAFMTTTISILLVDDQQFVGLALRRLLSTEKDMELHCCHDATAAIADANRLAPTIILQDLLLPGIDGLTIVGMLRANPATSATPIIVLSGNDDADTRRRAHEVGANDYLVKLPAKGDLIACLRKHAGRAPLANAAAHLPGDGAAVVDGQTLDPEVMAGFRQGPAGMTAFTLKLIDQFIVEAESRVETLHDAVKRRDAGALKATAHSLKGSSLIMGAQRLGGLCVALETALRAPDGIAPSLMTAIDHELDLVRAAFAVERQNILSEGTRQS
jgi:DNA-binding response OmpR family regulator